MDDAWVGVPPLAVPAVRSERLHVRRELKEGGSLVGRGAAFVGGVLLAMWICVYVRIGLRCLKAQRGRSFRRQQLQEEEMEGAASERGSLSDA